MVSPLTIAIDPPQTPIRSIYIYYGGGVYKESVDKIEYLFRCVKGPWEISRIDTDKILPKKWIPNQTLFILPGGRAGEYDEHLKDKVADLKKFVEEGGYFFGVCGGSYFASVRTVYQILPQSQIDKVRSLGFFQGTAKGPLIPSDREDISFFHGALRVRWEALQRWAPVLVSGGGGFIPFEGSHNYKVLASFDDPLVPKELSAAVVQCYVGKGMAILSSLHLGYGERDIDVPCYERCFPGHGWNKIALSLQGTESFRVSCFADLILSFSK